MSKFERLRLFLVFHRVFEAKFHSSLVTKFTRLHPTSPDFTRLHLSSINFVLSNFRDWFSTLIRGKQNHQEDHENTKKSRRHFLHFVNFVSFCSKNLLFYLAVILPTQNLVSKFGQVRLASLLIHPQRQQYYNKDVACKYKNERGFLTFGTCSWKSRFQRQWIHAP